MAQQGLAVRVVVIGGSATHGGACGSYALPQSKQEQVTPGLCSWAHRFVEWLKDHHRNPNIELFNLAVPATTSAWRLSHFDDVLSVRPDLLIVDYGASYGSNFSSTVFLSDQLLSCLYVAGINDPNMGETPEQKTQ